MKPKRLAYGLTIALLLCLAGCDEHRQYRFNSRMATTYFWTSTDSDEKPHLFLNGKDKGILPYSLTTPGADDTDRVLALKLNSGRYKIEVRSSKGELLYKENFKLKLNRNSTSIHSSSDDRRGGTKVVSKGKSWFKEIWFDE